MKVVKIMVTGGRDFDCETTILDVMEPLIKEIETYKCAVEIIQGDARGLDRTVKKLFNAKGYKVHDRPADWDGVSKGTGHAVNASAKAEKLCRLHMYKSGIDLRWDAPVTTVILKDKFRKIDEIIESYRTGWCRDTK